MLLLYVIILLSSKYFEYFYDKSKKGKQWRKGKRLSKKKYQRKLDEKAKVKDEIKDEPLKNIQVGSLVQIVRH